MLAPPGSGKTRLIVERVRWLLTAEPARAEQLLLLTFTRKAAGELGDRMVATGLRGETFHGFAADLLRAHGAAIGLPPPLRIVDRPAQDDLLRRAAEEIGCCLDEHGPLSPRALGAEIGRRKRRGLPLDDQTIFPPLVGEIIAGYDRLLRAFGGLDYDDLVAQAVRLLREDAETARLVRRRYRFVFVDEFHDVSPDQDALLREVAPPRSPEHQVMVVADPHQAIYGWRDASVGDGVPRFRRSYAPRVFSLEDNHRSAGNIVRAAHRMLGDPNNRMTAVHPDAVPVTCVRHDDQDDEAANLGRLIERARAGGSYDYGDIAVLYRSHTRADLAEATLIQRGIPIRRVRDGRFFDQPDVREALRYLDLIRGLGDDRDECFRPALNWPRVLVDELTMIHLQRLASADGLSLSGLARRLPAYADRISPLTRVAIEDFLGGIAAELAPLVDRPIGEIVEPLLDLLARRRCPLPVAERDTLHGVLDFLGQPLLPAVDRLDAAIAAGRPIALSHQGDLDSAAAVIILEWALDRYLRHPVARVPPDTDSPPPWFRVRLGEDGPLTADGFGLALRVMRTMSYGVATLAWRLAQMLLTRRETLRDGAFVLCDIETGGLHANTTELLEVAAHGFAGGALTQDRFHSLVRPSSPQAISFDAHQKHGIGWHDVRDAPLPAEVLARFADFVGETTLAGHNLAEFDARVLRRVAVRHGLPPLANPTLDTLALARRLVPDLPHRLHDLADQFGLAHGATRHRAAADVERCAGVFQCLLDRLDRERELDALTEALPLVALGIRAAGVPLIDENATLVRAGERAAQLGIGAVLRERLAASIGRPLDLGGGGRRATESDDGDHNPGWADTVARWRSTIDDFRRTTADQSLDAFLTHARLATDLDDPLDTPGRVTMLTMHAAKGTEWPLVFLLGVEAGTLPASRSDDPEEERRVLYVAMTRAKRQLCLLWSADLRGRERALSPFLDGLPTSLVRHVPPNGKRARSAGDRRNRST